MTLTALISDLAGAVRDKFNLVTPRLLPAGGAAGQVLAKSSAADFAAGWVDPAAGGGASEISDVSGLQAALDAKVTDADVRGGAANLNGRLGTISNFASPNAGGIVSGYFYDNNPHGGVGALIGAANRIDLCPFYSSFTFGIDQIGCAVSTVVAGSLFKIVIYATGLDGWPAALLYESADISGATAGYAFASLAFTFESGVQYWIGVRHSSTCTLRTVAVANAYALGLKNSGAATTQCTVIRKTALTYATPAPDPWVFSASDLTANITPPSIRFRAV